MAGGAARHLRKEGGRRRGRHAAGSRVHRLAALLALVISAVALGIVVLAINEGVGGASHASDAQASATLEADGGSQESSDATGGGSPAADEGQTASGVEVSSDGDNAFTDDATVAAGEDGSDAQADADNETARATQAAGTAPEVRSAVQPLMDNAAGTVSIAYASLSDTSDACSIQADRQMRSASMIKLAILAEYLRETDAGMLSGEETYTLRASDIVGGTGSLQGKGAGYQTTLDGLARLMVCESDNVAANVLIDRMGMDAINAEASSLGLSSTVLERRMMDSDAMAAGRDNYTSARDVARVLGLIGSGRLVSREASDRALGWLEQQTDRAGIPAGVPAGTTVGNKTGSLESARHDGAIVLGEHPYVLVVMTDGMGTDSANALISRVSRAVWQAVG